MDLEKWGKIARKYPKSPRGIHSGNGSVKKFIELNTALSLESGFTRAEKVLAILWRIVNA
jgi:hypothetical protein